MVSRSLFALRFKVEVKKGKKKHVLSFHLLLCKGIDSIEIPAKMTLGCQLTKQRKKRE